MMRLCAGLSTLDWCLLLLLLAVIPIHCADSDSHSRQPAYIEDPLSDRGFSARYRFLRPQTYDRHRKEAVEEVDGTDYYEKEYVPLERQATMSLKKGGRVGSPSGLRSHSNFIDFFDGRTHTPALYIKVADVMPDNPMESDNPDVAILMHRIGRNYRTAILPRLEVRAIIRGAPVEHSGSDSLSYEVVWENFRPRKGHFWLNELNEVFKWPVFPDLERFGYNPSTIMDEISEYDRVQPSDLRLVFKPSELRELLTETRRYIEQFDHDYDGEYFNTYSFVTSRSDLPGSAPWFQAPLFKHFDKGKKEAWLYKYDFRGQQFPFLDRIQYQVVTDWNHRSVLMPVAIVRPVRAVPAIEFKTIWTIPERSARAGAITLYHFKAPAMRLVPDPMESRIKQGWSGPPAFLFGNSRPFGHPLHYIAIRHYDVMGMPPPGTRALKAPNDASVHSSAHTQRAPQEGEASEPFSADARPPSEGRRTPSELLMPKPEHSDPVDHAPFNPHSQEHSARDQTEKLLPKNVPVALSAEEKLALSKVGTSRFSTVPDNDAVQGRPFPSKLSGSESDSPGLSNRRLSPISPMSQSEVDELMSETPRMPFKIPLSPILESPKPHSPSLLLLAEPSFVERLHDKSASIRAAQTKPSAIDADGAPHNLEEPPMGSLPKIEAAVDEPIQQEHVSPFPHFLSKRPRNRKRRPTQINDKQTHEVSEPASNQAANFKSPPAADAGKNSHNLEEQPLDSPPKIEAAVEEPPLSEHVSPSPRFLTKRPRTRFKTLAQINDLRSHDAAEPSSAAEEPVEARLGSEAATRSTKLDGYNRSPLEVEAPAKSAQADKNIGSILGKHPRPWTAEQYRYRPGPWPVRITQYLHGDSSAYKRSKENALDTLQDHLNPALDDEFGHVKSYLPHIWRNMRP